MPLASLPGPVGGIWHLGPLAVHGYAFCVVLGLLAVLWLAERRYRQAGGRPWLIVDIATVAVPAGLIGARIYRIAVDHHRYFGHGHDWVGIARIWDGGLGLPGAAAGGLAAAYFWCRAREVALGPVLAAAAPAVAIGAAISMIGNWFDQSLYGPPSAVPWAVPIAPASRVPGYQDFGTFQPLFLYEAMWNVAVGVALIYVIKRYSVTGDRAFAGCVAGYALGMLGVESFVLTGPHRHADILIKQLAAFTVLAAACTYVYLTRSRLGPEPLTAQTRHHADPSAVQLPGEGQLSLNASRVAGSGRGSAKADRIPSSRVAEVEARAAQLTADQIQLAADPPDQAAAP